MNIPSTQLGTSDPVTICDGLPIFPPVNVKLGTQFSGTFFNTGTTILLLRFKASAGYSGFFGLCGPAWALKMNVDGTATAGAVNLNVSNDEFMAGLLLGASFGLGLSIKTEYYGCTWNWWGPSNCGWKSGANISLGLDIDLIALVKTAVEYLLGKKAADKALKSVPNDVGLGDVVGVGIQSYGMFDGDEGLFAQDNGVMTVRPTFSIPINLWPLITKSSPAADATRKKLEKIHIEIGFGPSIGIQIPVTVKMHRIMIGSTTYSNIAVSGASVSGTSSGPDPSGASVIDIEFTQTPGLDFSIGAFASLEFLKVFKVGVEYSIPLLKTLGFTLNFGTNYQSVQNTIGQTLAAKGCAQCGVEYGLVDVVFE